MLLSTLRLVAVLLALAVAPRLAHAADLGEPAIGDPNAPVTIIEFASLTCPHCAAFHVNTLPELEKRYIDTGKVRLVLRDFPLDQMALKASVIAHCAACAACEPEWLSSPFMNRILSFVARRISTVFVTAGA